MNHIDSITRSDKDKRGAAQAVASTQKSVIPVRITRRPLGKRKKIIAWLVLAFAVILAITSGIFFIIQSPLTFVEGDKYQAVYLADGSIYFGKLHLMNDGSYRLTDVYYPQKASSDTGKASTDTSQSSALVKFGTELLGSEDQIMFNKMQVSYWVNLKSDSKVTKAIQAYKNQ